MTAVQPFSFDLAYRLLSEISDLSLDKMKVMFIIVRCKTVR